MLQGSSIEQLGNSFHRSGRMGDVLLLGQTLN